MLMCCVSSRYGHRSLSQLPSDSVFLPNVCTLYLSNAQLMLLRSNIISKDQQSINRENIASFCLCVCLLSFVRIFLHFFFLYLPFAYYVVFYCIVSSVVPRDMQITSERACRCLCPLAD